MTARVLVVDDIPPNVKLLEAKLSSEYFDVITATSGPEALEKAKKDSPDIVLLDVMMPGMDGFEVCKRLKTDPETTHIPVVMVTALTDSSDRVRGLEAGADDFLSKPVNDIALMARVRSLVRLKMTVDEWRLRENTASQFGVIKQTGNLMAEPVQAANVIIIEDKTYEREKFVETLRRDQDHVLAVTAGRHAIEECEKKDYDLIVVSLNLENEDGLRLCAQLRSNEKTRAVPVLMIAEETDLPRIAQGLEIGAHDYILRPVDATEFLARARTQIRRKRFQNRLRSNYEVSLSMALTDSLTGLFNRRYLLVHFQKLIEKMKISRKPIGVLMMDLDHFKVVNDSFGHAAGDEVLRIFSDRIVQRLRSFDLVARMGGEEFVAVLPDIQPDVVMRVASRLRAAVGEEPMRILQTPEGQITVTVSIGGAIIDSPDVSPEEALKRADDMLYEAKRAGRNCVFFENIGLLKKAEG